VDMDQVLKLVLLVVVDEWLDSPLIEKKQSTKFIVSCAIK